MHDLVGRRGRSPVDEVERVELRDLGPVEAEGRRALAGVADGVAVGVDVLRRSPGTCPSAAATPSARQHAGRAGLVDAAPQVGAEAVVERRLAAHDGVGALVHVGEEVVEDAA